MNIKHWIAGFACMLCPFTLQAGQGAGPLPSLVFNPRL